MTNLLLTLILLALIVYIWQTHQRGKKIAANLDALGEMIGDMLRELITKIERDKTK